MSYAYYQPNPCGKSVGDCTVRALSKALDQSWGETYVGLVLEGFIRGDLPNGANTMCGATTAGTAVWIVMGIPITTTAPAGTAGAATAGMMDAAK